MDHLLEPTLAKLKANLHRQKKVVEQTEAHIKFIEQAISQQAQAQLGPGPVSKK